MLVIVMLEVCFQFEHLVRVAVSFLSIVAENQLDNTYILIVPGLPRLRPVLLFTSAGSR